MHFSEKQPPILQNKESKTRIFQMNICRKHFHFSLSDANFAHKESSLNFRILGCVSQGKGCFTRTYARASNSDFTFLLSQVSQRAKNESSIRPLKGIVFPKTTYRFQQNNVSFSTKQRIVFNKTTCRFQQNNVSFSIKQRVVFSKTACCL